MSTLGERLKKERQRLGLNQAKLAGVCGVATSAQSRYELDKTYSDAKYLQKFAASGGNAAHVITPSGPSSPEASVQAASEQQQGQTL